MLGGFTCSRNALTALNILYIMVSFILVGVAAYGRMASIITNIAIVGGIIACGVFLFLLSLLGLIGALRHHQVMLFFYMVIMFMLFVAQFSIACACLAFSPQQQQELAEEGWKRAPDSLKEKTQNIFSCCGFNSTQSGSVTGGVHCEKLACCKPPETDCNKCSTCQPKIIDAIDRTLKLSGGVGLFFSFTEVISIWVAYRFRLLRNPNHLLKF